MLPRNIASRKVDEAVMAIGARLCPAFWCKINSRDVQIAFNWSTVHSTRYGLGGKRFLLEDILWKTTSDRTTSLQCICGALAAAMERTPTRLITISLYP